MDEALRSVVVMSTIWEPCEFLALYVTNDQTRRTVLSRTHLKDQLPAWSHES